MYRVPWLQTVSPLRLLLQLCLVALGAPLLSAGGWALWELAQSGSADWASLLRMALLGALRMELLALLLWLEVLKLLQRSPRPRRWLIDASAALLVSVVCGLWWRETALASWIGAALAPALLLLAATLVLYRRWLRLSESASPAPSSVLRDQSETRGRP